MRFSTASVALLGFLPWISSAPLPPPGLAPLSANDQSVLELALFLETLEYNLYTGGYEAFSDAQYTAAGFPPGFRENVLVIAQVTLHFSLFIHAQLNPLPFPARRNSHRHHLLHPPRQQHHPAPELHFHLPLQFPYHLRRPREHGHHRRHRRLHWRLHPPSRQSQPPPRRRLHPP